MDVASSKPGCVPYTTRFFITKPCLMTQGFTLIELVVTLTLLVIVSAYSFPTLSTSISQQRQVSSINLLLSSLYLTRSEAVMRNHDVMVCKSCDGNSCTSNGEREQGWLIFEDRDGDRFLDSDEPIIAAQQPLKELTIYYRAFGSRNYVVYTARNHQYQWNPHLLRPSRSSRATCAYRL